jgi:hypothetical protein
MANIQPSSQQASSSTLNPNGIKTFNKQITGTGLFDVTAGNINIGDFDETSPLIHPYKASYSNGYDAYPRNTLTSLLSKITMFIGIFII